MNLNRSRSKAETRNRILSAGYEIVSNRGYESLTRDKLSMVSGISKEEISEFFPTDDELRTILQSELDATIIRFGDYELGTLPDDATSMDKLKMRPTVTRVLGYIHDLIEEYDGPRDVDFLLHVALATCGTIHGITHLCTYGICRLLSPVAKKQLLQGSLECLSEGVLRAIRKGGKIEIEPHSMAGNIPINDTPKAPEFPRNNDEEKQIAVYRGLIDLVWDLGEEQVDISKVSQYADLPMKDVLRLTDGADKLLKTVEDYLDNQDQGFIGVQCFSLPGGANAFSYIKAAGYGYVSFALHDPIGWNVLIEIASGSIVPTDFDNFDEREGMGVAFSFLVELTKKAIENSESPRQTWILYSQVFAAWASAHGLAHLFSTGNLRNLEDQDKLDLIGPVFDIVIQGLLSTLNIESVDELEAE